MKAGLQSVRSAMACRASTMLPAYRTHKIQALPARNTIFSILNRLHRYGPASHAGFAPEPEDRSMTPESTTACKQAPGVIAPSVNFARCEGKADCAVVCPEDVFEIRRIDAADYQTLGLLQRFKLRVHGMKVAYAPNAEACRACGLCVSACPEHAVTLVRMR